MLALKSENSYLRDCTLAGAVAAGVQLPADAAATPVSSSGVQPQAKPPQEADAAARTQEQHPTDAEAADGSLQEAAAPGDHRAPVPLCAHLSAQIQKRLICRRPLRRSSVHALTPGVTVTLRRRSATSSHIEPRTTENFCAGATKDAWGSALTWPCQAGLMTCSSYT